VDTSTDKAPLSGTCQARGPPAQGQ